MTRILFFGRVSDAAGCGAMNADLPDDVRTVGELRAWLAARDGTLAGMIHSAAVRAAVDHTISHDDVSIIGAREIAFMSPMSGG
ncbi:MAG TPA: MoaD/ThiS family protein [Caulobacterales bacterium]|nr:MoaD/ThiS family protein [Caulobacterales bacterium]